MEGKVSRASASAVVEWHGSGCLVVDADTGLKPHSAEIGTLRENYREVREVLVEITTDPSDAPADCREEVLP